jgi:hypothetical protein
MSFRKLFILVICSIVAFLFVWLPDFPFIANVARYGNYWLAAAIFAAFLLYLLRELRTKTVVGVFRDHRIHLWGFVVIVGVTVVLQLHEPRQAKIIYDEDVICGVAYQMHEHREATYPQRMHYYQGGLEVTNSAVDKRPAMFPFLLSVMHDLTGYRVANVFYLNCAITFALLALLYFWTEPLSGPRWAIATVLLAGTLPLLAQNATGAGFELLNVCLIMAFVLTARRYFEKTGDEGLNLFVCVALMLATTRYESALYLLALAGIVLAKWLKERRVTLTWFSAISPLFAISALVTYRVIMSDDSFFQTKDPGSFFSLSYCYDNLRHDIFYLFSNPFGISNNSFILSVAGVISAIVLFVNLLPRVIRWKTWGSSCIVIVFMWFVVAVTTFITLIDNWGQWDDPMVARYSLPFQLALLISFSAVWPILFGKRSVPVAAPVLIFMWLALVSSSQMARHKMTDYLGACTEVRFFRDWANENTEVRDLFVDESGIGLMLEGHPCVPTADVNRAPWRLNAMLISGTYEHVYVCERLMLDASLNLWRTYAPYNALSASVHLRKLAEFRVSGQAIARISEVTGVDDPDAAKHKMPENPVERSKWIMESLP